MRISLTDKVLPFIGFLEARSDHYCFMVTVRAVLELSGPGLCEKHTKNDGPKCFHANTKALNTPQIL